MLEFSCQAFRVVEAVSAWGVKACFLFFEVV